MSIQVNKDNARTVLQRAFNEREYIDDEIGRKIKAVVTGHHITFRYILVTGILSKAADRRVDPQSLQVEDTSRGAYDARTIGHKVLVPFERANFPGGLGNSNEPFINNPARVPRLTKENKVRRGNDKLMQDMTVEVLEQMTSPEIAYRYLKSALQNAYDVFTEIESRYHVEVSDEDAQLQKQTIFDFINRVLSNCCMGESCVLVVATVEQLYRGSLYAVVPHNTNESGSSSREVGDIDVFNEMGELTYSIEVKDKNFTDNDVEHAIRKFIDADLTESMFIYGPNANFDKQSVFSMAQTYGKMGHFCSVVNVYDYVKVRMLELPIISLEEYANFMLQTARQISAKNATVEWITECVRTI